MPKYKAYIIGRQKGGEDEKKKIKVWIFAAIDM